MQTSGSINVKTEVFEGPLDLLLNLIEKRKLLINDISLAKVTDDYIEYVNNIEKKSMSKTSHFILIASTLLLIKSKSLLPTLDLSSEEQESIDDLEKRLKIYKRYKELSVHIDERFGKNIMYEKLDKKVLEVGFAPSNQITFESVFSHIKSILTTLPKVEKVPEAVVKKVISLEETIGKLSDRIRGKIEMSFREFSNVGKEEKVNIIVSFLAMLELVKQGSIRVKQESDYEDIHMSTKDIGTPSY
jgi:segregation and condensation protein A